MGSGIANKVFMNASHSKVILDGLLDGMEGNVLGAFQGGNGAGNFEDAGVGAGAGVEHPSVSQPAVI